MTSKKSRARRRSEGICRDCPERTGPGHIFCEKHLISKRKRYREVRAADPEKARAKGREWQKNNPAAFLLSQSRVRAKKCGGHVPIGHGLPAAVALALVQSWIERKPHCCEFCGGPGRLGLDHNHKTGRIRAWLCAGCNHLEGLVVTGHIDRLLMFIASREVEMP